MEKFWKIMLELNWLTFYFFISNLYFEHALRVQIFWFPAILMKDNLTMDNLMNSNLTPYKFDEKYDLVKKFLTKDNLAKYLELYRNISSNCTIRYKYLLNFTFRQIYLAKLSFRQICIRQIVLRQKHLDKLYFSSKIFYWPNCTFCQIVLRQNVHRPFRIYINRFFLHEDNILIMRSDCKIYLCINIPGNIFTNALLIY